MPAAGTGPGVGTAQPSLWSAPPPVAHAVPDSGVTPTPAPAIADAGSFGLNVTSPAGLAASATKDAQQSGNMIEGLTSALFGAHGQGGVPIISDIAHGVGYATSFLQPGTPIGDTPIGAIAQAAGKIPGALGTIGAGALSIAGGALEHVPSIANILSGGATDEQLATEFAALPNTPEKQQVVADIAANKAPAGHLMDNYIRANLPEAQKISPNLFAEAQVPPSSFADDLSNVFGLLGTTTRLVERPIAGMGKLTTGLNRLQEIEAVHNGAQYTGIFGSGAFSGSTDGSGHSGNTPVEELALQKWKDGTWSMNQALDYLTAAGEGYSHDTGLEMAGQIALDPQVFGSVGAAGLAKLGVTGLRLVAAGAEAEKIAATTGEAAKAVVIGGKLGGQAVSGVVRALGEHVYAPIANNALGQSAKIIRTIVDPLHAIGGNKVVGEATVDIASGAAPKIMAQAHGPLAATQALEWAKSSLPPEVSDKLISGVSTYSANVTRDVLMKYHEATMMVSHLGRELIGRNPGEIVSSLLSHAPTDWADLVKTQMTAVRKLAWDDAAKSNLGDRFASIYGGKTAAEYTAEFAKMSPDTLGYLHAVSYGSTTEGFLDAIGKATRSIGKAAADQLKLPRLVLMNEQTLSDVKAQAILDLLNEAKDAPDAATTIRAAQQMYPELAYLGLDPERLSSSVERFINGLSRQLADGELPAQVRPEHLAQMPQEVQAFAAQMHGAWDLGFRPSDEIAMGLKTDAEGMLVPGRAPWVDHVAVANPAYRGTWAMAHNVAGMPIVGSYIGKAIDYMEAGAQTLTSSVTSNVISAAARARFEAAALMKHPELTSQEARAIYQAVEDMAGIHEVAVRGLSGHDMWQASRALIPDSLALTGKMTQRDLMTMIVDAYQGDLRFVGLTQKFTGRVKSWLAAKTGSNFAGQFSENLYQKIRFKYNPLFQIQERVEPWVLNGQRGVNFALGTKLTENDRRAAVIYERLKATGLVRASNMDIAEQSAQALVGSSMEQELGRFAAQGRWAQLRDVSGAKVLNELRTFSNNMGKTLRASMDKGEPGTWDAIVAHYSAVAGHLVSDDEAALRRITEGALGGDVRVSNLIEPGANFADFKNAIAPREWHVPSSIGEVKSLDLNFMAKSLGLPLKDGTTITTVKQLRAALADPAREVTMQRLTDAMNMVLSPHPDYTRRVVNALDFNWNDFWRTVGERYNMSTPEVARWQRMFQDAASLRHMTPVDYVSQVWSPTIAGGLNAGIEEIGKGVNILRAPAKGASESDLIRNMVDIFRSHLDPSAQDTLIQHFGVDIGIVPPGEWTPESTKAFTQAVIDRIKSGKEKVQGPVSYAHFGSVEARPGVFNATVPDVFKSEPGYVYRTVSKNRVGNDWAAGEYAAKHPATVYARGDTSIVLRAKQGDRFVEAQHGVEAGSNVQSKVAIPASEVEVLDARGKWVSATKAAELSALLPVDPDVERAVRMFSKWSKNTLSRGLLADDPNYANVLKDVTGIPTDGAVPYNEIHQLMVNHIGHAMRQASEDAFRLQYFARNRSFIERSINHPFFGIYPASYMWGKILPELVKFVAQSPFGIRTGAMAYAGSDIATALAVQLEYDPNFQKLLDTAGKSSIFWMLGYLLPALPWDVGAAAPTWARDLAAQGLDNQLRVDQGLPPKPIDFTSPIKRIGDYISPFRSITQTERVTKEVQNVLWPASPAGKGSSLVQQGGTAAAQPTGPTQGTELGPVLADSMAQLQNILSGQ